MNDLCQTFGLKGFVCHPYSGNLDKEKILAVFQKTNKNRFIENLNKNKKWQKKILLENITEGFFKTQKDMEELLKKTKTKMCMDLCHLYMTEKNNKNAEKVIKEMKKYSRHFHIVYTKGKIHDSLKIGEGKIDFSKITKYIKYGIIEVDCECQIKAEEMIESYYSYKKYLDKTKVWHKASLKIPKIKINKLINHNMNG